MSKRVLGILLALNIVLLMLSAILLLTTVFASSKKESIIVQNEVPRVGPYSQMVRAGDFIFCASQVAFDPATGKLIEGDTAAQTKQILSNYAAELNDAGLTIDDTVDVTVYMKDMTKFSEMNEVYAQFFTEPYPTRACVEVSEFPVEGALVMIKITVLAK